MNYFTLFIGCNSTNLQGASNDAIDLSRFFWTLGYNDPNHNIKLIGDDASSATIKNHLSYLKTDETYNELDLLIFGYSGHGYPMSEKGSKFSKNDIALVTPDFVPEKYLDTGIMFDDLIKTFCDIKSDLKILILDCCYSNKILQQKSAQNCAKDNPCGTAYFTTSSNTEQAKERKVGPGKYSGELTFEILQNMRYFSKSGDIPLDVLCENIKKKKSKASAKYLPNSNVPDKVHTIKNLSSELSAIDRQFIKNSIKSNDEFKNTFQSFCNIAKCAGIITDTSENKLGLIDAVNFKPFCDFMREGQVEETIQWCKDSDETLFSKAKDNGLAIEKCKAGLFDIAAPIKIKNETIAYVCGGQLKSSEESPTRPQIPTSVPHGIKGSLNKYYQKIESIPKANINDIATFLRRMTELLIENIYSNWEIQKKERNNELIRNVIYELDNLPPKTSKVENYPKIDNVLRLIRTSLSAQYGSIFWITNSDQRKKLCQGLEICKPLENTDEPIYRLISTNEPLKDIPKDYIVYYPSMESSISSQLLRHEHDILNIPNIEDAEYAIGLYAKEEYFNLNATHFLGAKIIINQKVHGFIKVINKIYIDSNGNYIDVDGKPLEDDYNPVLSIYPFNEEDEKIIKMMASIAGTRILISELSESK